MERDNDCGTKCPLLEQDTDAEHHNQSQDSLLRSCTRTHATDEHRLLLDSSTKHSGIGEDSESSSIGGASSLQFYECDEAEGEDPISGRHVMRQVHLSDPALQAAPSSSTAAVCSTPSATEEHSHGTNGPQREEPAHPAMISRRTAGDDSLSQAHTETPSVLIEMRSIEADMPSSRVSPAKGPGSNERHCFICLQDGDADNSLIACCTQCYACTHILCWREWRHSQCITGLRSRLLGHRTHTNNLLRCTICKTGTAVVSGEEDRLQWMGKLLCGGDNNSEDTGIWGSDLLAVPARREDSDEEHDASLEDLVDTRTCFAFIVYLVILILGIVVATALIVIQRFYAGDVVLCCVIGLYELSILQMVAIAVMRRRSALIASAHAAADVELHAREAREVASVAV